MSRFAAVLLAAVALAGCSGDPEPSGLNRWRFGHTTLGEIKDGLCQPTDLNDGRKGTWCFAQPPLKVGGSVAEVDLYFLGGQPDAPLIEIQLKVRGCREDGVESWMRQLFGAPIESKATRAYWKNSHLWAAAFLPSEPGRCLIHFLPLSESGEITRIRQQ